MTYRMTFRGTTVPAEPGQSVGAALVAAGITDWRTTRKRGRPRGLFCGIGVCFDCLITIDGAPGRRACLVPAADGMRLGDEAVPGCDPADADPAVDGDGGGGMAAHGGAGGDARSGLRGGAGRAGAGAVAARGTGNAPRTPGEPAARGGEDGRSSDAGDAGQDGKDGQDGEKEDGDAAHA